MQNHRYGPLRQASNLSRSISEGLSFKYLTTMSQRSDLLHEKVDVHLCVVHDKTMWAPDPLQSFIHGLTIDVDPTGSSRSQEISESHTQKSGRHLIVNISVYFCMGVCLYAYL